MATQLRDLDVDLITRGHLEKGLERLREEFAGTFSAETVERFMAESLEALGGARLNDFVPLFVHRFARERLRALGQVEGTIAKTVPDEVVQAADAVITMGCGDACPIYPGKRYEDWDVADPAETDLDGVRRIRDDISGRVERLLAELTAPVGAAR